MLVVDRETQRRTLVHRGLVIFFSMWMMVLSGCGGAGKARDELTKTASLLESVRKKGCSHDSLALAEDAYAKAQRLFDEKKYDEAQAQARAAKQLAGEVDRANGGKPCEAEQPEPVTEVKAEASIEPPEDAQIEPFSVEEAPTLKTIYFGFDSIALSSEAIDRIEDNLKWLRDHPSQRIVLGGHCDERGSTDYNIALSDRRAKTIMNYLMQAGVEGRRLEPVGYGSEQPASFRRDEEGHRLNRRVEFKLAR